MTSSEERRDVAKKIREYVDAYGDKIEDAEMVLLGTVWCRGEFNEVVRPTSEAELLAMVADLIDPTCEVESVEPIRAGEFNQAIGSAFHLTCGHTAWRACTDEPPVYCEECGARVVDDE